MGEIYEKFKNHAKFICVYIVEAHPLDEWNLYAPVCFNQPKTLEERIKIAQDYGKETNLAMPIVVDLMTNATEKLYSAWPERLYVVHNGKIAHKGGKGPRGYHPEEAEEWLQNYLKT